MGKAISQLAPQRGFEVKLVLDIDENQNGQGISAERFRGIDVAVDFTQPDAVVENAKRCAAAGCNLVVGTTGWYDRIEEVRKVVAGADIGMVYAANFSIGVQLFYRLSRAAAEIFFFFQAEDGIRDYKVTGVQTCALPISRADARAWPLGSYLPMRPSRLKT